MCVRMCVYILVWPLYSYSCYSSHSLLLHWYFLGKNIHAALFNSEECQSLINICNKRSILIRVGLANGIRVGVHEH